MEIYYKIWVDCILKLKSQNNKYWKYLSIMHMSFYMCILFMLFMTILENHILHYHFYNIKNLDKMFSKPLSDLIDVIVLFFLPMILINYLLIFYNNKYEKLINIYDYKNGKLFLKFLLLSVSTVFLSFLLLILTNQVK